MQNNITELTQKLLRSLDSNYNVIDMPTVIEIVSLLEKVNITKELLETTRLGKHVNELRRKTNNDSLSKRAKELVRKWRNMLLPEPNGHQQQQQHMKTTPSNDLDDATKRKRQTKDGADAANKRPKLNGTMCSGVDGATDSESSQPPPTNVILINSDSNSSQPEITGISHLNTMTSTTTTTVAPSSTITTTTTAPSSPTSMDLSRNTITPPLISTELLQQQQPKKRGRKKGSKNHKNLIDDAETSFTNKLAISRSNTKVKTTQELLASLQNKNKNIRQQQQQQQSSTNILNQFTTSSSSTKEDELSVRAAKLTERVSIIDQKLQTNANRYRNKRQSISMTSSSTSSSSTTNHNHRQSHSIGNVLESGSVYNDKTFNDKKSTSSDDDVDNIDDNDEIIVVDDGLSTITTQKHHINDDVDNDHSSSTSNMMKMAPLVVQSLSVEDALAKLPPIDNLILNDDLDNNFLCTCQLIECTDDDDDDGLIDNEHIDGTTITSIRYKYIIDDNCLARIHLNEKYRIDIDKSIRIHELHGHHISNVNGNWGIRYHDEKLDDMKIDGAVVDVDNNGLYANVVPNVYNDRLPKICDSNCNNFNLDKKYCDRTINNDDGDGDDDKKNNMVFREWHHVVDTPSYEGEVLRILPYVIID